MEQMTGIFTQFFLRLSYNTTILDVGLIHK